MFFEVRPVQYFLAMIIPPTEIRGFDAALSLEWLVDCVPMRMSAASAMVAGYRAFCIACLPRTLRLMSSSRL